VSRNAHIYNVVFSYGNSVKNRRTRRKTCPSATLSTTNPTLTDPGAKPDLRVERTATNRLSHPLPFFLLQFCGRIKYKLNLRDTANV
jgi:hypothetical protein